MANRSFIALRGKQGEHDIYTVTMRFADLAELVSDVDPNVPPREMIQRPADLKRIAPFVKYLEENREYIVPGVTVLTDTATFKPFPATVDADRSVGTLTFKASSVINFLDGQHRGLTIKQLVATYLEKPSSRMGKMLANDTVTVSVYVGLSIETARSFFVTMNYHVVKPSKTILTSLASKDNAPATIARRIATKVPFFKKFVEHKASTTSGKSECVLTIARLASAVEILTANVPAETAEETAVAFFSGLAAAIPPWNRLLKGEIKAQDLRNTSLTGNGVFLESVAVAGAAVIAAFPADWQSRIAKLGELDYARDNETWKNRCVFGGTLANNTRAVKLTTNVLKYHLDVKLTNADVRAEETLSRSDDATDMAA